MTKFFLIVCALLLLCAVIFFFLWRLSASKMKSQKETIDRLVKQVHEANATNSKLEQTINILKNNREKADEKIDDLHSGDSVDNALNELHNDKN